MTGANAVCGSESGKDTGTVSCAGMPARMRESSGTGGITEGVTPDTCFEYERTPDGIRLVRYLGDACVVRLPEEIGGVPVTVLGSSAFYENGMQVEKIIVPGSVKRIEDSACEFCLSLQEMELQEGVEELGREFMVISEQMELFVPSTVRRIDHPGELGIYLRIHPENPWYFGDGFGLYRRTEGGEQYLEMVLPTDRRTSYAVLEGTTGIADGAFENQEFLEEITLPASLTCIAEGALSNIRQNFTESDGIRRIRIAPGNTKYFLRDAGLYERLEIAGEKEADRLHIPEDAGSGQPDDCRGPEKPAGENEDGETLKATGQSGGQPDGCRSVNGALEDAAGEDGGPVKLIRYIGNLQTLRLPENTREIGTGAFLNAKVHRITIPAGVKRIYPEAFLGCALREVVFEALGAALYMPYTSAYFLKKAAGGFGGADGLYDFSVYDAIIRDEPINYEKIRMLLSRLAAPFLLTEAQRQDFFAFGEKNLSKMLYYFLEKNDLDGFAQMAALGFITSENVDSIIGSCSSSGNLQALAIVMDYKNSRLGATEFDFSL